MQQGTLKINDTVKWLSLFEKPFDNEAPVIGRHRDYYLNSVKVMTVAIEKANGP